MTGFITHIHDFARENELTIEEWMQAVNFVRHHKQYDIIRNADGLGLDQRGWPNVR